MSDPFEAMLTAHRSGPILVDANLLLLLLLGDVERSYIGTWNRTRGFTIRDYEALSAFVEAFRGGIIATPNVLTEVSNLANDLKGPRRTRFFERFAEVLSGLEESYIASITVCRSEQFAAFGLTDLGLLQLARSGPLVLTDDGRLAAYLGQQGVDVVPFDVIRALNSA